MNPDALLSSTDVEEALSLAYTQALAAGAGYVISKKDFDRDGVDVTIEAGAEMRPKIDAQLKATINLPQAASGAFRYACPRKNYDKLRIATQTPRLLIVLHLPPEQANWLTVSPDELVLRRCAYWVSLRGLPETENETSVTINLPNQNRLDVQALKDLMDQSRSGTIG